MQAPSAIADTHAVNNCEHWINLPQGQIHAQSWTPDDCVDCLPIVLFHDSLGCVALWRDFPARLADLTRRTVIAYDRLGFGRSSPHPGHWSIDFIQEEAGHYFPAIRTALGIKSFIALGYSVGGAMAACCAALNPGGCKAVITMAAPAMVDAGMIYGLQNARRTFSQPSQLERLAKYHGDKAQWALSTWLDTWLSDEFADWHIKQVAPRIACPLLVIHGEQDEYGSIDYPQHIAALAEGFNQIVLLKDCHHVPHREYPELVLAAVAEFLGKAL